MTEKTLELYRRIVSIGWKTQREESRRPQLRLWTWFVVFVPVSAIYFGLNQPGDGWLNWYLTFVWSLDLLPSFLGLAGAFLYVRARTKRQAQGDHSFSERPEQKVIFMVPSICRLNTVPALCRVVDSVLEHAPYELKNWRVDVVTEEGAEGLDELRKAYDTEQVRIVVVPKDYSTPLKTKYKARANQYALDLRKREGENTSDIFVYHLDDDTAVGKDTVQSISQFLMEDKGQYHAAQGILTFPWQLSRSFLTRMADSIRPADDLTRFYFFTGHLGRPLAGFHGEHLLLRANVEEEIGWDFGPTVKVEDAYFALYFNERYPGKSTFLDSYTYGASPETVSDLIKQRRRWASGLLGLLFDRSLRRKSRWLLRIFVANWVLSPFRHVAPILLLAIVFGSTTSPVLQGIVFVWTIGFTTWLWQYLEGLRINLSVSEPKQNYFLRTAVLFPMFFVITMVETVAVTAGAYDFLKGQQNFEVISKRF